LHVAAVEHLFAEADEESIGQVEHRQDQRAARKARILRSGFISHLQSL
jgi:hypothetical protein